jgi:hypothetical protein
MTEVRGGPPLHIPKIGTRIGLDLHRVNVDQQKSVNGSLP